MNRQQATEIGQKAKAAGYAVRIEQGKAQFVTVEYDEKGRSTVTPRTDWLGYDEALDIILG